MKSKELLAQEKLVTRELAKLLDLSAEHFPEERGGVVDIKTASFVLMCIQAPSNERTTLLSAHVLSPATSEATEYNSMTIADIKGFGITSTLASLFADKFRDSAPELLKIAEQIQITHLEGGHA